MTGSGRKELVGSGLPSDPGDEVFPITEGDPFAFAFVYRRAAQEPRHGTAMFAVERIIRGVHEPLYSHGLQTPPQVFMARDGQFSKGLNWTWLTTGGLVAAAATACNSPTSKFETPIDRV